ncbi:MAG: hypothetical protein ACOCP4_06075 [Candidatus Woesearchaeota archaeon]
MKIQIDEDSNIKIEDFSELYDEKNLLKILDFLSEEFYVSVDQNEKHFINLKPKSKMSNDYAKEIVLETFQTLGALEKVDKEFDVSQID